MLHAQATVFTIRPERASARPMEHDTDVMYSRSVAAREIDRQEWSRVVHELLVAEANGNRTQLAERIGVKYLTIKRWLDATNAVSEESVRQVARAFRIPVTDLLIRVGYYPANELAASGGRPTAASRGDALAALIEAAPVTPSQKREMREFVKKRRDEADQAIKAEIQRWIDFAQQPRRRTS